MSRESWWMKYLFLYDRMIADYFLKNNSGILLLFPICFIIATDLGSNSFFSF